MDEARIPILDDLPTERDALDFSPYVNTLAAVCRTASTPITIGVFGSWGSGKTSLMRMIRKKLPKNYTTAWFDAWKYTNEETLWRAFLLAVLLAVEEKQGPSPDLDTLKTMLYRGLELEKTGGVTIDLEKLGGNLARGAVQIGLSFIPPLAQLNELIKELQELGAQNLAEKSVDAIRRERTKVYIEQVRSLEQFQEKFAALVAQHVRPGRLVVFVDDLDRCLPEKAVEVLEAIKLFLDAPGCVFVLGLDRAVIERGVEVRYKEFERAGQAGALVDGGRYLEKIIQLPFTLPQVERSQMGRFVSGLAAKWPHRECPAVFAEGLGDNPRQIKRTVNAFLMLWRLAYERRAALGDCIKAVRLAKVVTIQAVSDDLYRLLAEQPGLLRDIEQYYRQEAQRAERGAGPAEGEAPPGPGRAQLPEGLLRLLGEAPAVRRILLLHPLELDEANFMDQSPDDLRPYFTLARRAEAPPPAAQAARLPFEPQMVPIPAGPFLMGTTPEQAQQLNNDGWKKELVKVEQPQHTMQLSAYAIAKYPVTCREYQAFVLEAGRPAPRGWSGSQYPEGRADHPVVNVSWEDASAYCAWLSNKSGRSYRLPTEAEWEKAARGADGRVYPWGDEFDPNKANTSEGGPGSTTAVGQYSPQGDSPYGCADMAGNVWEWCGDWFDETIYQRRAGQAAQDPQGLEDGQLRVLRGGSWLNDSRYARCSDRYWYAPDDFDTITGFRVFSPGAS